ncbi:MAG: tRNA adenosine(34) deaminase TadA [Bacteroidetes bacterium]|nr:tRNA adenosine(34) deaminase TadA [Bacteroidota bacterium]
MALEDMVADHRRWMKMAIREAEKALDEGEVPVGAIVVHGGQVVGRGHNQVERLSDPTAHAEIIAITAACDRLRDKFLTEATLYVTLEPCPMCAGAITLARLKRVVYGAFDEKAGAASTLYNIPQDPRLNHYVDLVSGVEEQVCASLLTSFFRKKRNKDLPQSTQ